MVLFCVFFGGVLDGLFVEFVLFFYLSEDFVCDMFGSVFFWFGNCFV